MPHVVAITRPPRAVLPGSYREAGSLVPAPMDAWLGPIAAALGLAPYDLRLRVAGPVPWIVARVASAAEADLLLARVRDAGAGAVSLDLAAPLLRAGGFVARAFAREEALRLEPEGRDIAWPELTLVVRATLEEELGRETTRFSPNTFEGVTTHARERARRHALYVCERSGPLARLVEGQLGFFGETPEPEATTARARFEAFVERVKQHARGARFHDAFVAEPRKRTSLRALTQSDTHRSTLVGNVEETDLAVALLSRALAEGQAS